MKKTFYTLLALSAVAFTANAQTTQQLKNGAICQVVKANPGEKVKVSDVITFNIVQRTQKDSILFSSYKQGQPVKIQVQPSKNVGDLMDAFLLLAPQDSAIVKVPVDSIFKGHETEMPPFMKKGDFIVYNVKVEKVQTINEAIAERNEGIAKYKGEETAASNAYIKAKGLVVKTTPSGLRYAVTKMGTKPKPLTGDTVYVAYTGRLARTGQVFDTSVQTEAKAAGVEQPGRPYQPISFPVNQSKVIAGWDEGLLLLNEGSKATFVIPSALGYGEQGQPGSIIGPFADMVFDLELVKVVRVKRTAPVAKATTTATKGKTAVKKRTTVKKKN